MELCVLLPFFIAHMIVDVSTSVIDLNPNWVHWSHGRGNGSSHLLFPFWMKRHTHRKGKWSRSQLTYAVTKYSSRLDDLATLLEVERAFSLWSSSSPFAFRRVQAAPVDINIRFETRIHKGCHHPFDGRGGSLAHVYFPKYGGDIHLDDDEPWAINHTAGVNLIQVLTHAIGHSLGLPHSQNSASVMFPEYTGYNPHFGLHDDDKLAIQALYRPKNSTQI